MTIKQLLKQCYEQNGDEYGDGEYALVRYASELFEERGVEWNKDESNPFDSPGLDVYVVSIAWIEDEEVKIMMFDFYIS